MNVPATRASPGRRPRGGRGGAEPRAVIRAREARVVDLSTRGWTQRAIAADLGISQPAVSKILQRTDDRALATLHRDRIRLLVRHLRRREHVLAEAHQGWERSCADRERQTQRRVTGADGQTRTAASLIREPRAGDPRFLGLMLRAVQESDRAFRLAEVDWVAIAAHRRATDAAVVPSGQAPLASGSDDDGGPQ